MLPTRCIERKFSASPANAFLRASLCYYLVINPVSALINSQHFGLSRAFLGKCPTRSTMSTDVKCPPLLYAPVDEQEQMDAMREEIENMRAEASARIEVLTTQIPSDFIKSETHAMEDAVHTGRELTINPSLSDASQLDVLADSLSISHTLEEANTKHVDTSSHHQSVSEVTTRASDYDLLDCTHWKINLNIGREPGTWMPKTWGISGERLLLNLEVCFDPKQNYEHEDSMGNVDRFKLCRVIDSKATLGPSVKEGSKDFRVKDGGWGIAKGGGPAGTDLLKFFVEIEEKVLHLGGDVYCPAGRVYATCGYFPMHKRNSGRKLELVKILEDSTMMYTKMKDELDNEGFFSLKKIQLMKDLFQLKSGIHDLRATMNDASVIDPDMSILRISKNADVGLTREGGLCCKVQVSPVVTEFHILGKFAIAAVYPRDGHE